jgi:hypothetical protein
MRFYIIGLSILYLAYILLGNNDQDGAGSDIFFDIVDADELEELDKLDGDVNCNLFLSDGVYFYSDSGLDGVLDYLKNTKHKYSRCKNEIDTTINDYCKEGINRAINYALASESKLSDLYKHYCWQYVMDTVSNINDKYKLPGDDRSFVFFVREGLMIDPLSIKGVSFGEVSNSRFWRVTVHTSDKDITLYYGDKTLWEQAKVDMGMLRLLNSSK